MGQPSMVRIMLPYGGRTQGSETSQYLKEKKSNEIPKVAASEMGYRTNRWLAIGVADCIRHSKSIEEPSGKLGHRG